MSDYEVSGTIDDILDKAGPFIYPIGDQEPVIQRIEERRWAVTLDGEEIGRFSRETQDRATYYVFRTAEVPHEVNWVSDSIDTGISRLLILA